MAQISYIKYTDVKEENRMDAEFHRIVFYNHQLKYVKIEDILTFLQYGISIEMNEIGVGYKIYRMNEIENMFCSQKILKYADISKNELNTFKLEDRDVLFNRTNSFEFVGRTGIFRKFSEENLVFASYLVRARPNEKKVLPEYLTAFLNTKYGIFDIKRRARISINQSNVSASELKKIKIPLIDLSIQYQIKEFFEKSYQKQTQSQKLYREAEEMLLAELGLLNYQVKHELTFSTTKKEIEEAHRYDSEYFQPKYAEIIKKIEEYEGGYFKLSDKNYAKISRGSLIPDVFYNSEKGTPYIRGADFSSGILGDNKLVYIDSCFEKTRETMVKKNDIVFSLIGSVGATAVVPTEFDNSFISNNTGKISVKNFNSIVLQIIFQSIVGKSQFEKEKTQTAQPKISSDQVGNFKIPLIKPSIQKQIAEKIQESHKLRKESKELLEEAKRKVEEEIEKE